MFTLDLLAESFLGGAALERPGLSFATGPGKGGSSRRKADDEDEADDDDLDDDDLDPEDDEDDDDEDDDTDDMDEDELKAELRKVRDQLSRSTSGGAAKRKRIKKLRAELDEARKPKAVPKAPVRKTGTKTDDDPVDAEVIRAAARAEAAAEANSRIVKAEARGALKAAGIPGAQVGRLVGMLKLDDIDIDDDGEVDEDSLGEAIESLRSDWPQLFPDKDKRKPRERVSGAGDTAGTGRGARKPPTTTERQVAAALGKSLRK